MNSQNDPPIEVDRCAIYDTSHGHYLLLKRTENGQFNAGKWEFPGGKRELGAEHFPEDLTREVLEEAGLKVVLNSYRPFFEEKYTIKKGKYANRSYVLRWFASCIFTGHVELSNEHSAYVWASLDEARRLYTLTGETVRALQFLEASR